MPATLLADDFEAIARALQRETSSSSAVLHFWDMLSLLTSTHECVEAAVVEAHAFMVSHTAIPVRITATDGTVLMDDKALTEAIVRHDKGMPV